MGPPELRAPKVLREYKELLEHQESAAPKAIR